MKEKYGNTTDENLYTTISISLSLVSIMPWSLFQQETGISFSNNAITVSVAIKFNLLSSNNEEHKQE